MQRKNKTDGSGVFSFLINFLSALREYVKYVRAVRFMKNVYPNADFIIYCLKKAAISTGYGQRLSITIKTAAGDMVIAIDKDQPSKLISKEDELFQNWKDSRSPLRNDE